ncbi:hypothetical protein T03_11554 [Trichinella britovi]|uniref:Uncharacterized protein n=1 Tax=Trichinella britovi TaxID=45882 RepID=A0A0V1CXR7_TRIBR|nr:hypothetical protein T03_11554 [Trichinella britovi]
MLDTSYLQTGDNATKKIPAAHDASVVWYVRTFLPNLPKPVTCSAGERRTDYGSGDLYIELRIVYSYGSRDQRSRQELLNRINSTQSREAEHPYR